MTCLRNRTLLILLFWLSISYATQNEKKFSIYSFPSKHDLDAFQIVTVSSDRILQKCIFLNAEAENKWRHLYFIFILNDKNEAIQVMYPLDVDISTCVALKKKIKQIYKKDCYPYDSYRGACPGFQLPSQK